MVQIFAKIKQQSSEWRNQRFPQNYIIKNPVWGALIIGLFCFGFLVLYRPLDTHEGQFLSYTATMAVYSLAAALSLLGCIHLLRSIPFFSNRKPWTFAKEVLSILLLLIGLGIVIYLMAFAIEPPADRWNLATFWDSLSNSFLLGVIPFAFFLAINYHHWLTLKIQRKQTQNLSKPGSSREEEKIQIRSRLKKEKLGFYPSRLIYAESDGNYVVFHLSGEDRVEKQTIRNSISDIEQQLSVIPYLFRTHRAFIVNIRKVVHARGNVSGYRLTLEGTETQVPVSRQRSRLFQNLLSRYQD